MEFNTIKNHPDFLEVLAKMGAEVNKHERNVKIGGACVTIGSAFMTFGMVVLKVEHERLKRGGK